jgi:hypothetical protein
MSPHPDRTGARSIGRQRPPQPVLSAANRPPASAKRNNRGLLRDPRHPGHLRRGRRRMAGVRPRSARPRPGRSAGHLRRACRTHYTVNVMSVCPKSSWSWMRSRCTRCSTNPTRNLRPPIRSSGPAGVHRVPQTDLAPDLVEQPRNDSTRRSAAALTWSASSRPRHDHPPGQRCPRRTARRMDRRPPLAEVWTPWPARAALQQRSSRLSMILYHRSIPNPRSTEPIDPQGCSAVS